MVAHEDPAASFYALIRRSQNKPLNGLRLPDAVVQSPTQKSIETPLDLPVAVRLIK